MLKHARTNQLKELAPGAEKTLRESGCKKEEAAVWGVGHKK
jgi:hypothetical protein